VDVSVFSRLRATLCAAWLVNVAMLAMPAVAEPARPRIISLNLCADQLLVTLADPDQILGLSPYAHNRARSWAAEAAAHFPALSGTAEEVLAVRPDIVLGGGFTRRATQELLKAQGVRLVELDIVRSLDDAARQMTEVGALLGHPARAAAEVDRLAAAVARARQTIAGQPASLDALGLDNAGAALTAGQGGQVPLEAIVTLKPDLLLIVGSGGNAEDQGSALLRHPALAGLYPPERRIVLPERLTVCGGPMLAEAVERLAAQVARRP
jgi:iron complex transport system substrate-binding protein